jgi:hypothetical protein
MEGLVVARVAWRAEDVHLGLCLTGLGLKHSRVPDRKEEMYVPGWFLLRCSRPLVLPGTDFGMEQSGRAQEAAIEFVGRTHCVLGSAAVRRKPEVGAS